jgi:hypothetical protein
VTVEVTSEVTASDESAISSSRIIVKWAEPKPFPERDLFGPDPVQIWWADNLPVRLPTAEQIAKELFAAMVQQPICAGRWILAQCIEDVIYPVVCQQLSWPPRPWLGRQGVAHHLAKLSPHAPRYIWVEVDGERRNLLHYFIPSPQTATVAQLTPRQRSAVGRHGPRLSARTGT